MNIKKGIFTEPLHRYTEYIQSTKQATDFAENLICLKHEKFENLPEGEKRVYRFDDGLIMIKTKDFGDIENSEDLLKISPSNFIIVYTEKEPEAFSHMYESQIISIKRTPQKENCLEVMFAPYDSGQRILKIYEEGSFIYKLQDIHYPGIDVILECDNHGQQFFYRNSRLENNLTQRELILDTPKLLFKKGATETITYNPSELTQNKEILTKIEDNFFIFEGSTLREIPIRGKYIFKGDDKLWVDMKIENLDPLMNKKPLEVATVKLEGRLTSPNWVYTGNLVLGIPYGEGRFEGDYSQSEMVYRAKKLPKDYMIYDFFDRSEMKYSGFGMPVDQVGRIRIEATFLDTSYDQEFEHITYSKDGNLEHLENGFKNQGVQEGLQISEKRDRVNNIQSRMVYKIVGGGVQKLEIFEVEGKNQDREFKLDLENGDIDLIKIQKFDFSGLKGKFYCEAKKMKKDQNISLINSKGEKQEIENFKIFDKKKLSRLLSLNKMTYQEVEEYKIDGFLSQDSEIFEGRIRILGSNNKRIDVRGRFKKFILEDSEAKVSLVDGSGGKENRHGRIDILGSFKNGQLVEGEAQVYEGVSTSGEIPILQFKGSMKLEKDSGQTGFKIVYQGLLTSNTTQGAEEREYFEILKEGFFDDDFLQFGEGRIIKIDHKNKKRQVVEAIFEEGGHIDRSKESKIQLFEDEILTKSVINTIEKENSNIRQACVEYDEFGKEVISQSKIIGKEDFQNLDAFRGVRGQKGLFKNRYRNFLSQNLNLNRKILSKFRFMRSQFMIILPLISLYSYSNNGRMSNFY